MGFTRMAALVPILIAPHAATADIKRHKAVPDAFRGEWIAARRIWGGRDDLAVKQL
ncbi:hypothetical protein MPEAHAMD_6013 [Methylobacterium frigidaeris]|jgi:hypothetical protein|uniref:Uncharacterized protein n=1 Tax=Methylobacterium frigidaeris TaxID=2038277 RepID=A0AA37HGU3_9HYPH|nr:hypothetical protein MPEAHAMD_6013 [Methylobacterium frigidaeris]